jgi:transcriptional regulator of acetoin/glycerol metabolism
VVSLDRQPVFPLVEQGAFLSTLYYRLNIVSVMAGEIGTGGGH